MGNISIYGESNLPKRLAFPNRETFINKWLPFEIYGQTNGNIISFTPQFYKAVYLYGKSIMTFFSDYNRSEKERRFKAHYIKNVLHEGWHLHARDSFVKLLITPNFDNDLFKKIISQSLTNDLQDNLTSCDIELLIDISAEQQASWNSVCIPCLENYRDIKLDVDLLINECDEHISLSLIHI